MAGKSFSRVVLSATLRKRLAQVEACEKSGKSLKAYAERRGLSVDTLYQAKKEARRQGLIPPHRRVSAAGAEESSAVVGSPRFVKVVRRAEADRQAAAWQLRFPGGEVLESNSALTPDFALCLIESLGRHS